MGRQRSLAGCKPSGSNAFQFRVERFRRTIMTQLHKILSLIAMSLLMAATAALVRGQSGTTVVLTPGAPTGPQLQVNTTVTGYQFSAAVGMNAAGNSVIAWASRSEEHTSELQSLTNLVCRLLLEKKN